MAEADIRIGCSLGRTGSGPGWKRPAAERDRRAKAGMTAQVRGQITKTLKNQPREQANRRLSGTRM